jgi:Rad3-related DNA helicase
MSSDHLEPLLGEQIDYYRAIAEEYSDHAIEAAGGDELSAALDAFKPAGDVLELACGPGTWTGHADRRHEDGRAVLLGGWPQPRPCSR